MPDAIHTLDNATFHVTFRNGDEEFTGACSWEVKKKQLAEVFDATEMDLDFFSMEPEEIAFDSECDDEDEEMHIGSADALVVFAAAASTCKPATYEIDYYGSGYWFFHDMIHAKYDSGDGSAVFINSASEVRALPMGAKLAAEAGVSISEILRELVKAGNEFEDRFGFAFDPVESFLDSVEFTLTVNA